MLSCVTLDNRMKKLFLFCLLLVTACLVQAQTRYVSDKLDTPIPAGAALRFKILRMLPSGTALAVLQTDAGNRIYPGAHPRRDPGLDSNP